MGKGQEARGREQRAEGRGQKAEGRGQRAEVRGQRAEGRQDLALDGLGQAGHLTESQVVLLHDEVLLDVLRVLLHRQQGLDVAEGLHRAYGVILCELLVEQASDAEVVQGGHFTHELLLLRW
jgi:hypothetical protein